MFVIISFCFSIALTVSSILKLQTKLKKFISTHFLCSTYTVGEVLCLPGPQEVLLEQEVVLCAPRKACWLGAAVRSGVVAGVGVPRLRKQLLSLGLNAVRELVVWVWWKGAVGRTFQAEGRVRRPQGPTAGRQGWRAVSE